MRCTINPLVLASSLPLLIASICTAQSADEPKASKKAQPIQIRIEANSDEPAAKSSQIQVEIRNQTQQAGPGKAGQTSVSTSGKIVIVGPDGQRREFSIGDSAAPNTSVSSQIKQALKNAGVDIQLDVDALIDGAQTQQRRLIMVAPQGAGKAAGSPRGSIRTLIKKAAGNPAVVQRMAIGVQLATPSAVLRSQLRLQPNQGLVVQRVMPNMPAAKAGLEALDIITQVNGKPLTQLAQLQTAVKNAGDKGTVKLTVLRQGKPMALAVRPGKLKPLPGTKQTQKTSETTQNVDVKVIAIDGEDLALDKIAPALKNLKLGSGTIQLRALGANDGQPHVVVVPSGKNKPVKVQQMPGLQKQLQQLQEQVRQLQKQVQQLQSSKKTGK